MSPGTVSDLDEKAFARMLKAIHAQESREARARKAEEAAEKLEEALNYTKFPPKHWCRIRINNGIERVNREIGRRRVVGTFPDGSSTLMLVTARLKYIVNHEWGKRRYPDMSKPEEMDELKKGATR